jgi:hypothetical protein
MVGLSNTISQIPGIVGVAVTGWLVDITGTYSAAFGSFVVVKADTAPIRYRLSWLAQAGRTLLPLVMVPAHEH